MRCCCESDDKNGRIFMPLPWRIDERTDLLNWIYMKYCNSSERTPNKTSGIFERRSINLKKHCIFFSSLMKHPLYYCRWNYFWCYIKIKISGLVLSADSYSFHYFLYIKAFYYFQFLSCIVEDISIFFTRRMQWKKLPSETAMFWWMYGTWHMIICSF